MNWKVLNGLVVNWKVLNDFYTRKKEGHSQASLLGASEHDEEVCSVEKRSLLASPLDFVVSMKKKYVRDNCIIPV